MRDSALASDVAQVREVFRMQAEDRLLRSLKKLGARDDTLDRWLGHPWSEGLTPDEFDQLDAYVERAEDDLHSGKRKKAPPLPPRT